MLFDRAGGIAAFFDAGGTPCHLSTLGLGGWYGGRPIGVGLTGASSGPLQRSDGATSTLARLRGLSTKGAREPRWGNTLTRSNARRTRKSTYFTILKVT